MCALCMCVCVCMQLWLHWWWATRVCYLAGEAQCSRSYGMHTRVAIHMGALCSANTNVSMRCAQDGGMWAGLKGGRADCVVGWIHYYYSSTCLSKNFWASVSWQVNWGPPVLPNDAARDAARLAAPRSCSVLAAMALALPFEGTGPCHFEVRAYHRPAELAHQLMGGLARYSARYSCMHAYAQLQFVSSYCYLEVFCCPCLCMRHGIA